VGVHHNTDADAGPLPSSRRSGAASPDSASRAEPRTAGPRLGRRWAALAILPALNLLVFLFLLLDSGADALTLERRRELLGIGSGAALLCLGLVLIFIQRQVLPHARATESELLELRSSSDAARRLVAAQAEFYLRLCREARASLGGLAGMAELVLRSPLSLSQERQLRMIDDTARALLRSADDVLDFSELSAQTSQLLPAPCSLHELLRGSLGCPLRRAARDKGLELQLELAPDVPDRVLLDAARLRQVLLHLLENAVQLTESGNVKLCATAPDGTAPAFELCIRVEDTSPSLSEHARELSFEPFSAVPTDAIRAQPGSGLGPAIAQRLVTLMRGQLRLLPRSGPGRAFEIRLPVTRLAESSESPSEPANEEDLAPPPLRLPSPAAPILIVDDDPKRQLVLVELVENLGFELEVAGSAEDALTSLLAKSYALILIHCQLGPVDGYDATSRIREVEAAGRRVPIIGCTPHVTDEDRDRLLAAGMDAHLLEPLTRDALCRVLAQWLPEDANPASSGTRLSPSAAKHAALRSTPPRPGSAPDLLPLHRSATAVNLFVTRVPDQLRALAYAAEQARLEEVATRASDLKAACLSCGAMKMAALCTALMGADQLSVEQIRQDVRSLGNAFTAVLSQLGAPRPESEPVGAPASGNQRPDSY
jgi:signal transduction histidine kinase/CheY-like chemotaxis protein